MFNTSLSIRSQKALLNCGILSSLLYFAMCVFVPVLYTGYSSTSQTISELSAINAPTRSLWVLLGIIYTVLFTAFGYGIVRVSKIKSRLRLIGWLTIAFGIIGIIWPFAPMHMRGQQFSLTDAMHIAMGVVSVLLMLLIMVLGAPIHSKLFRLYSVISIIIFIVFGVLTGLDGPRLAENLPTPYIGIWERINIGVFLAYIVVLARILIQGLQSPASSKRSMATTTV